MNLGSDKFLSCQFKFVIVVCISSDRSLIQLIYPSPIRWLSTKSSTKYIATIHEFRPTYMDSFYFQSQPFLVSAPLKKRLVIKPFNFLCGIKFNHTLIYCFNRLWCFCGKFLLVILVSFVRWLLSEVAVIRLNRLLQAPQPQWTLDFIELMRMFCCS